MAAAGALQGLGPEAKDAVPALIRGLERSSDFGEKLAIVQTLGAMGAAAKDALPLIALAKVQIPETVTNDERGSVLQQLYNAEVQIRSALPHGGRPILPSGPRKPAAAKRGPPGIVVPPPEPTPPAKGPNPPKADAPKKP